MLRQLANFCVLLVAWPAAAAASCLGGDGGCKFTLQQESTPQEQPWTQPARAAYTFNNNGDDSFALDIAGKAVFPLKTNAPVFLLADGALNKNNQQNKEQNNLRASGGLHFEFQSSAPGGQTVNKSKLFSLWIDAKLGYNRKAVYADKTKPACVSDLSLETCKTQYIGSMRGTIDVSPYWGFFESNQSYNVRDTDGVVTGKFEGPGVAHSLGIIGTFFYDNATESTIDPDTGKSITGVVTGFKGKIGGAISPKFTGYRAVLRTDIQGIWATSRAAYRKDDFGGSSHLVTVSLDWDLSDRSFLKDEKGIKPSVGVTYTSGSDPLVGREKQSTWVVSLKVAFK